MLRTAIRRRPREGRPAVTNKASERCKYAAGRDCQPEPLQTHQDIQCAGRNAGVLQRFSRKYNDNTQEDNCKRTSHPIA